MALEIRRATHEDVSNICEFGRRTFDIAYRKLFKKEAILDDYLKTAFSKEKITKSVAKEENNYWVVYIENQLISYAKVKTTSPSVFIDEKTGVGKLQRIYVSPDSIAQGIGGKLHQFILDELQQEGLTKVWLSVLKINTKAIRFYKKYQYRIIGEHLFTIGDEVFDFWVMCKKIP
ncbi:GNAT family N-acetyltransferase [Aquimarina sp. TRL1]|uniref:GNAT family N-acetyltransferase n=1 Tax=Aquimarina sp. (strain TRL1) TaxID=2736252 RepID=UPI001588A91F|nr:GNAT family N-acetyltransferase [Aquimarina sp. TRL1]QKX06496.1 GNAT family N-acetyltransferase [Aquimarina sp. TRL1]